MKKFILLFIGLLLSACASYDIQQEMRPNDRSVVQKLPNLEPIFETGKILSSDLDMTNVQHNSEFATLFRREIEKNLVNVNGSVKGKLILEPIFIKEKKNGWWVLTAFPGYFIPNLFGVPLISWTAKWELELNVLDKNGKRIARYSGEAEDTEYAKLYKGGYSNPRTAAVFKGYKKALDSIIKQLGNDIPVLSGKLKSK